MQSRCNTLILEAVMVMGVMLGGMSGQRRGFPKPPESATASQTTAPEVKVQRRFDTLEMEREARELSTLAASLPGDVEQIKKGLLPKNMPETLKRIEKLSKHLRSQIQ